MKQFLVTIGWKKANGKADLREILTDLSLIALVALMVYEVFKWMVV